MTGCGSNQFIPAVETADKINILVQGKYYGQPNAKRAASDNDTRQCVWRDPTGPSTSSFTAPLIIMPSSTDGIIEYQADHFDGQLRGNLITSKYTDGLYRVILTPDGLGVIPQSVPPIPLVGDDGLSVTQAPNGNLIEVRLNTNSLHYHMPNEAPTTALQVKAVFPRRGGKAGGTKLSVYGVNLNSGSGLTISVGSSSCPILTTSATRVDCTLPGGNGTVNVIVSSSAGNYTFQNGYRFITGF